MLLVLFITLAIILNKGIRITAQSSHTGAAPPKIAINYEGYDHYEFANETLVVMSNFNALFELVCNASYPIEWIFHYDRRDNGISEKVKVADTYRTVGHFDSPKSYNYSATLLLEYSGQLLALSNFTCKATETDNPAYQRYVYLRERNEFDILLVEVGVVEEEEKMGLGEMMGSTQQEKPRNCDRALVRMEYNSLTRRPCWECLEPQLQGTGLKLDFQPCSTPIQCNSMLKRQQMGKDCLEVREETSHCTSQNAAFFPGLILCKNFGPALAQFYFFGVFKGHWKNREVGGPPIFFSWEEAHPSDMIYIHPIQKAVYLGEDILVKCEYSRFYFSLGSWIGVSGPAEPMEYIEGVDIRPCETEAETLNGYRGCNGTWQAKRLGTYYTETTVHLRKVGPHRIYCFGPVWNTTQWVNASLSFLVEEGEDPEVTSLGSGTNEPFIIGQENRSLHCNFRGRPEPQISWEGPNDTQLEVETLPSWSILRLKEIGKKSSGEYTCKASSFLGNHSRTFRIQADSPSWPVTGIVFGGLLLFVLVASVIGRLVIIILRQRQALRLLTETEVQEFMEGKPELARADDRDYLDNQLAIDALAYDQKYEIKEGKLAVDYTKVLGSGQFGVVLEGKLKSSHVVTIYVNLGSEEGSSDNREVLVAVKTIRKDVDVISFKGILSEVKVMAYLGQHENIVSLVGALTTNIRNRELLIVLEFCHNGSLDQFLIKNKGHFVNKVKYGFYKEGPVEETENSGGPSYCNVVGDLGDVMGNRPSLIRKASGWEFSTLDLFLWTHDIAQGLEYIHSKKVIHGDLAIRNVFMTNNYIAKVGDFGLSRQLGGMSNYIKKTQCPLPWRNMAVESLKELNFSPKSDIWSLGVTIWELFTLGGVPYPGMTYSMEFLREMENGSLRLFKPPNATNDLYELLLMMWSSRPEDRPRITDLTLLCKRSCSKQRAPV